MTFILGASSTILLAGLMASPLPAQKMSLRVGEDPGLGEKIHAIFEDSRFSNAHWGVLVESADSGAIVYERNADRLFIPASNQKVPTTIAALNALGPDFRFETRLSATGEIIEGVLHGDLVVTGYGDPTMYERFQTDSRDAFRAWAAQLKEQGITRVTGRLIGDDSAWEDSHIGFGWPFAGLVNWYYAEYGPLLINENYVDITVQPPATAEGQVRLVPNMPSSYYTLVNNITVTTEGRTSVSFDRPNGSNVITFTGQVRVGDNPFERTATITNPTLFYATVLKETLTEEGIVIDGPAVDCGDIEGWELSSIPHRTLVTHQSPPLAEILAGLFKRSQNMYSEVMVSTLGWKETGRGSVRAGRTVVEQEMAKMGLTSDQYIYRDGSGLSRFNHLTPRAIARMYRVMLDSPHFNTWWNVQPIAGVDGTLRSRLRGTTAAENVRAKTGTLANTRALSGYVTTGAGELVIFSTIVNASTRSSAEADELVDAMLVMLAEYGKE